MKINLVCYEDPNKWILGKFALKMQDELSELGIESQISSNSDPSFDINHHIIYLDYKSSVVLSTKHTLMITHVDNHNKYLDLNNKLKFADLGICMSKDTMQNLVNLGIPKNKLCFINPAHDEQISPRKILIGITCRVQIDGRKREYLLNYLADNISNEIFEFHIMGENWGKQIEYLERKGFSVTYYDEFNKLVYNEIIEKIDYYLYTGKDEGQMGFIDALSAGVIPIVTPQGYHLDIYNSNILYFDSKNELLDIFLNIQMKRMSLIESVENWTWKNYTIKHVEIWKYLLNPNNFMSTAFSYDGVSSLIENSTVNNVGIFNRYKILLGLFVIKFRHVYFIYRNKFFNK